MFAEDADGEQFLKLLESEKNHDLTEIFAYCLFNRAAHLVVKEGLCGLTAVVMRLSRAYANYYNKKYNLSGKLFYGRFLSEPLETPETILDATRFVHRLPLLKNLPLSYEWSSYRFYFKKSDLLSGGEITALAGGAVDYRIYCDNPAERKFLSGDF